MRLDHLLSKEKSKGCINVLVSKRVHRKAHEQLHKEISGGDALMGHTRSHPEHDG